MSSSWRLWRPWRSGRMGDGGIFWRRVHPSSSSFFTITVIAVIVVSFVKAHRSAHRRFFLFIIVYFVLLYIYDLLATVILLAPLCFVRLLYLYELLCWIEFSISHLLPSSPEYYTERQHPWDPCVAVTLLWIIFGEWNVFVDLCKKSFSDDNDRATSSVMTHMRVTLDFWRMHHHRNKLSSATSTFDANSRRLNLIQVL